MTTKIRGKKYLTEQEIKTVGQLVARGVPQKEIAKQLGYSDGFISSIKKKYHPQLLTQYRDQETKRIAVERVLNGESTQKVGEDIVYRGKHGVAGATVRRWVFEHKQALKAAQGE